MFFSMCLGKTNAEVIRNLRILRNLRKICPQEKKKRKVIFVFHTILNLIS